MKANTPMYPIADGWERLRGGFPSATLATFRPLAAGSAREIQDLAPQAASRNPPHRLGSLGVGGAAAGGGRSEVKRSRAGAPHGEPRTESPAEDAEARSRRHRGDRGDTEG
jgi:hypothetical protein